MPVYIEKSGDLVAGCHHSGTTTTTNEQGKIGLLSQWTMECWDEQFAAKHQWGTNHFLRKNMITGHQLWWTWNGRGNSKVEVECWPASWKRLQHIYKVREIKTQRGRLEFKTKWYKYSKVQFETPVKKGQLCVCSGWGPFVKDQKGSIMFFFCRDLF